MNENCQFHVGQIITLKSEFLKSGSKEFHYTGLQTLLDEIVKRTSHLKTPYTLKSKVKKIDKESISVEWINPWSPSGEPLGLTYVMKEYEFEEYSNFGSVVVGHTHVAPALYTHSLIPEPPKPELYFDPRTFEEINPQTRVTFKSTKLVANKIQNPKDIENFLLMNP